MKSLDRILVPVDLGPDTQAVTDYAGELAKLFGAKLQLLFAIEEVPHFPAGLDLLKQAAEERLVKLHDEVASRDIACDPPLCVVGRSFDTIVRTADKVHAHLIVMGRGGSSDSDTRRVGTTTSRVMRRTSMPVVAVVPGSPPSIRRILCPVDGSNPSARGLKNAISLARTLHARLTVMTVIPDLVPPNGMLRRPDMVKIASDYQKMERDQFNQFVDGFEFGDIAWDKEVHYGHPTEEIIALARDAKYDLIVMGSTGRSGLPRILLGSTAETVVGRAPCPVLTVKRDDVLTGRLAADLSDLNRLIAEGQALLEQEMFEEAIGRFDQCLLKDPYLAQAIEGQATAHERLGHSDVAADLREQAALIRRELWNQELPEPALR